MRNEHIFFARLRKVSFKTLVQDEHANDDYDDNNLTLVGIRNDLHLWVHNLRISR